MKKIAVGILLLSLVLLLVISCSSDQSNNQKQVELDKKATKVKLRWLGQWYGEGKKEDLIREIARDFSFLNQDIEIELEFPFEMVGVDIKTDFFQKVKDSMANMVLTDTWPYDLMLCDAYYYKEIGIAVSDNEWGEKYLVDFKNENWFKDSHKKYVMESKEYTGKFGGIAPGAFIEGAWNLLYVSSLIEEKLGIQVKDYDMTIDDLIDYARAVHTYNQSHADKITFMASYYSNEAVNILNHLVLSEIGDKTATEIDPMAVLTTVYQKLAILAEFKPGEQYHAYATDRELLHDKALFHYHATWATMFWQKYNPEGEKLMRPCELPSMTGKIANAYPGIYNAIFVVPKHAENKEAAIKLMQYICSPEIAEKWENYSKCPTGLKNRIALNEFGTGGFSNFSKHMSKKYNNQLLDANLSNILFGEGRNVYFYAEEILDGRITASQALSRIRQQAQ